MDNEAKPLIYTALMNINKELKAVGKTQFNAGQKFKFRGIDDFINALHPLIAKYNVFITQDILNYEIKENHVFIQVRYDFTAEDGSKVSSSILAEGRDNFDKAIGKSYSAALKVLLTQTFLIPTEDLEEGDFENPESGSRVPVTVPKPAGSADNGSLHNQANKTVSGSVPGAGRSESVPAEEAGPFDRMNPKHVKLHRAALTALRIPESWATENKELIAKAYAEKIPWFTKENAEALLAGLYKP